MTGVEVVTIEDPSDSRLAPYAAIRERDLVGRQGRFIVEGEITLRTMLSPSSRFRVESVLLLPQRLDAFGDLLAALPEPPPVYSLAREAMSALAGFPIHRGVLAVGLRGETPDPETLIPPAPSPATVLGLVGLTNHDNVGGLFRNAAAFGAEAVLLDDATCDPLYRKAIRVSAGAALSVPFARLPDAQALLDLARRHDLVPLALTPQAEDDIAEIPLPSRVLVLLGSEGPGLPAALMAKCRRTRIGMAPGFDSLNVATAGAIALHRHRGARAADELSRPLRSPHGALSPG